LAQVFLCRKPKQAEGLNEDLRHKKRVVKTTRFSLLSRPHKPIRNEVKDNPVYVQKRMEM